MRGSEHWAVHERTPAQWALVDAASGRTGQARVDVWTAAPLDVDRLRHAWATIRERHFLLRPPGAASEVGSADDRDGADVVLTDARGIDSDSQPSSTAGESAALLHVRRLADHRYHLVLHFPRLAVDDVSARIVLREILAAYRGETLPAAVPASEYRAWLRQEYQAAAPEPSHRLPAPTVLAVERAPHGQPEPGVARLSLDAAEGAAVRAAAGRFGVDVTCLATAAWLLTLHEYSEVSEIVFGIPVDGRPSGDQLAGSLVGRFRTTTTVCIPVLSNQCVADLLDALSSEREKAERSHFRAAGDGASARPDNARPDNVLHVDDRPAVDVVHPDMVQTGVEIVEPPDHSLEARLVLADRPHLRLHYDRRRLPDEQATRLLAHLRQMLNNLAAARPDTAVGALTGVDETTRRHLLYGWNDTDHANGESACIHELFERQAIANPAAVAVVQGHARLTYGELDRSAERIAARLATAGVRRGDLVGIYLDRSIHTIAALLGVLKAGAAYVPVETSLPADRVRRVLTSVRARVVLASPARLGALLDLRPDLPDLRVLLWVGDPADALDPAVLQRSTTEDVALCRADEPVQGDVPPDRPTPDDLAYIIFTSGSTGVPKGVEMRHASVVNLIRFVNQTFEMNARDRVLFVTSLSFDLSVYDIFGLLAAGGSIRVASERESRDPTSLMSILESEPITFWDSAPAALQQLEPLFALRSATSDAALRLVFLSGDWVPLELPPAVRSAFPGVELVALGGATEAAIWSNYFRVGEVDPAWTSIPYGRPIWNARYYVLDDRLRPKPIGVPGDLYIGGRCLASGYHGDPDLTARKFVRDPFGDDPEGRLYHTGDRARFWPDGTIEFLGRRDNQVKIRGFRIELGEIEATLATHPAIAGAAAVVKRKDNQTQLAAYAVPREGVQLDVADLRTFLAERLPDYMVPATMLVIPALPLTTNGKVDRAALTAQADRGPAVAYVAPVTAVEKTVAEIWGEALGCGALGLDDDFFDRGGHSLLASRVIARLRVVLAVKAPLRSLMEHSRLGDFAAVVERLLERSARTR